MWLSRTCRRSSSSMSPCHRLLARISFHRSVLNLLAWISILFPDRLTSLAVSESECMTTVLILCAHFWPSLWAMQLSSIQRESSVYKNTIFTVKFTFITINSLLSCSFTSCVPYYCRLSALTQSFIQFFTMDPSSGYTFPDIDNHETANFMTMFQNTMQPQSQPHFNLPQEMLFWDHAPLTNNGLTGRMMPGPAHGTIRQSST